MRTIIKNTKSIEEYKQVKVVMEMLTLELSKKHKQSVEVWEDGEPIKAWWDEEGNLCIEYESGKWWHYNEKGEWK